MVGSRSGETHRLGDRVTVKLVEAAPVAGALRFELLSEGRIVARRAAPAIRAPARQAAARTRARSSATTESAADDQIAA